MKQIFNNKLFKLITSVVKFAFIFFIVVYIAFTAFQRLSGNKSIFGYRLFTVATGSMQGVYNINDVIAVRDFNTDNLKVGDDVAYIGEKDGFEGLIVTHRIIKIENSDKGKVFFTKGVKSDVIDPAIMDKQILGKVIGKVPVITLINHVVKTQLGFFSLVFCPLVLIIVLEILQTITDYQLEKEELYEINREKKIINKDEEVEIL